MPLTETLKPLPIYALAFTVLLGAFSRFTHGIYTPTWYAFQEYHAPDDGSIVATLTPIIDTITGLSLLFGARPAKYAAAAISLSAFGTGLWMQASAGKEWWGDVGLVVLAAGAVWGAWF
ncbi:hypothetical protein BJY04DRAFT_221258 [Aspergillus karnatakaensis]|uniref:uncharacterized protein n=1 Tax=Aspergillus karnatakaensis TaxID=1810916 RepID=UPI003CCCE553